MTFHERVLEILSYDPQTGNFTWLAARDRGTGPKMVGKIAGSPNADGYLYVSIDGRKHRVSRLAFFYMTGRWPHLVDHINRNRIDNRWCNLREVNGSQNRINYRRAGHKEPPDLSTQYPEAFA